MNEQLNQKRQIALFFAKMKGQLFVLLNEQKMGKKKTPAHIRQKTAKRPMTARPSLINQKPADPMANLWNAYKTSRFK